MNEKTEIVNDLLGYDGLKIIQRTDMFNFSLDSSLLADFVRIPAMAKNIMDFGTGNAPIPLFLSLKTTKPIIGVEIQEEAFDLGKRSVEMNHLENQISILHADIKDLHKTFEAGSISLIVSNPPFFKYHPDANVNKNDYLTIARHEVMIDLKTLLIQAKRLLSNNGTLCLIHRADRLEELILSLHDLHFALKRMRFVYPKVGKDANSVLIEAKANGKTGSLRLMDPLYVYDETGEYSSEILKIFRFGKKG
jgi:tRNA1(Val) A37 N6-methylase TrmN6